MPLNGLLTTHLPTHLPTLPLQVKPAIYVTYNGDYFDWPFIGACLLCLLRWLAVHAVPALVACRAAKGRQRATPTPPPTLTPCCLMSHFPNLKQIP